MYGWIRDIFESRYLCNTDDDAVKPNVLSKHIRLNKKEMRRICCGKKKKIVINVFVGNEIISLFELCYSIWTQQVANDALSRWRHPKQWYIIWWTIFCGTGGQAVNRSKCLVILYAEICNDIPHMKIACYAYCTVSYSSRKFMKNVVVLFYLSSTLI